MKTLFFFALLSAFTSPLYAQPLPSPKSPATVSQKEIQSFIDVALSRKLDEHVQWLNLGHYKKTTFGFLRSQQDGPYFFISPKGKSDPKAELVATIESFYSSTIRTYENSELTPQWSVCQYPARWKWLSRELNLPPSSHLNECEGYEKFIKRASAKSVTMVFSSFYVNNPSSAFGHSLLRLNKTTQAEKSEGSQLLDLGVNYAANPTTTFPLIYSIYGLIGMFDGTFTALPYYYKVREYSDFDSRDLWEYDLNLSQEEIDMLVAHLWELGFATFDYYFFTENCSYHMLTLLDVAAPRLNLVDQLPFWIIPSDTIKVIWEKEGLVEDIQYRPSIHTQLIERLKKLKNENLLGIYNKTIEDFDPSQLPPHLSDTEKADVLDAAIDLYDKENFSELVNENAKIKAKKYKLLIARSRLDSKDTLSIPLPKDRQPHEVHDSARFRYTHLVSTKSVHGYEVAQRFALHDLMDPLAGYPKTAGIQFFNFVLNGSYEKNDVFIREIGLFEVQTLQPITSLETPIAWRASLGAKNVDDKRCQQCLAGHFTAAAGFSFNVVNVPTVSPYFLLGVSGKTSPSFIDEKFSAEGGPIAGLRTIFTDNLIMQVESSWMWTYNINQVLYYVDGRIRWAPYKQWSFEAGYRKEYQVEQFLGSISYYY
jgi:hypothetical protein